MKYQMLDREREINDARHPNPTAWLGLCLPKPMQVAANQMLEREELRLKIEVLAVRIIQRWWKSCVRRMAKIAINKYDREVM